MYSPLYRLEQEFDRQGLKLSRQTMSNWLLTAAEDWLQPIYDVLHQQLCKEKVLHGDETTLQVLHEKGKSAVSKSYMWLYRTSRGAEKPIVLYDYQPNRKAENAEQFLEGFSGWLHADGYQGYAKTRPVFDGYKAARYSKKYLAEHEAELAAYRKARATMSELLDGARLPKMDVLKKKRRSEAKRS